MGKSSSQEVPSTTKCVASLSKGCFPSVVNFKLIPVSSTALPVEIEKLLHNYQ